MNIERTKRKKGCRTGVGGRGGESKSIFVVVVVGEAQQYYTDRPGFVLATTTLSLAKTVSINQSFYKPSHLFHLRPQIELEAKNHTVSSKTPACVIFLVISRFRLRRHYSAQPEHRICILFLFRLLHGLYFQGNKILILSLSLIL